MTENAKTGTMAEFVQNFFSQLVSERELAMSDSFVIWFENLRMTDVEKVGGKNASLGEMISQLTEKGVRVPGGFATTADAFRAFIAHDGLGDKISAALKDLNVDDVNELARVGKEIRQWIIDTPFPQQLEDELKTAWEKWLQKQERLIFPLPCVHLPQRKTCLMRLLQVSKKLF